MTGNQSNPTATNLRGIFCPRCGSELSTIFDTRKVPGGKKRLRRCFKCEHVYPTIERVVEG
mgnify:CR=1 FL=1